MVISEYVLSEVELSPIGSRSRATRTSGRVVEALEQLWREEPDLLLGEPVLHVVV